MCNIWHFCLGACKSMFSSFLSFNFNFILKIKRIEQFKSLANCKLSWSVSTDIRHHSTSSATINQAREEPKNAKYTLKIVNPFIWFMRWIYIGVKLSRSINPRKFLPNSFLKLTLLFSSGQKLWYDCNITIRLRYRLTTGSASTMGVLRQTPVDDNLKMCTSIKMIWFNIEKRWNAENYF